MHYTVDRSEWFMLPILATMAENSQVLLNPQELEKLMVGLAAGDRDSLAALYHRTRAAVYGLALSYLKMGMMLRM